MPEPVAETPVEPATSGTTGGTPGKVSYWDRRAELHRKNDQDVALNAPTRFPTEKVADGSLDDMLSRLADVPATERLRYTILLGGGSLSDTTMQSMLKERQPTAA